MRLKGKQKLTASSENLRIVHTFRERQREREAVKQNLNGPEKRKALDDLLKKEVPAKKKRKAELDRSVEKASKISKQMEQNLKQKLLPY